MKECDYCGKLRARDAITRVSGMFICNQCSLDLVDREIKYKGQINGGVAARVYREIVKRLDD